MATGNFIGYSYSYLGIFLITFSSYKAYNKQRMYSKESIISKFSNYNYTISYTTYPTIITFYPIPCGDNICQNPLVVGFHKDHHSSCVQYTFVCQLCSQHGVDIYHPPPSLQPCKPCHPW